VTVAEPVLRVIDVSKRFNIHKDKSLKERLVNFNRSRQHAEEFWALKNVSFELQPASTLGLIGHNGSGKSTLLKVIGGILTPNTGTVERRGRLAALLELGAGFHGDLSGRENVYLNASILGLTRRQTDQYFDQIVDFSGIEEFIDTQVKFYSSGMYVRLAFAVAVHVDPEILLVDEVLAVGDEPFQRKCLERIKDFQRDGRTIVFVTHGLDMVRQLCDRALLLEHGKVIVDGTPVQATREFRERYTEQEDAERPPPDHDSGDEPVRLVSTTVVDGSGAPARRFAPGEELNIDFEVESRGRQEEWAVGFAITNQVDTLVYSANTTMLKVDLPPLDGRARVRIAFGELPLVEGQYTVSAVVARTQGSDIWHRQDRGAEFRVYSPVGEQGIVHMRPRVSVLEPAMPAVLEVTGR